MAVAVVVVLVVVVVGGGGRRRKGRCGLRQPPPVLPGVRRLSVAGVPAGQPELRAHVLQGLPGQHPPPKQEEMSHVQSGLSQQVRGGVGPLVKAAGEGVTHGD